MRHGVRWFVFVGHLDFVILSSFVIGHSSLISINRLRPSMQPPWGQVQPGDESKFRITSADLHLFPLAVIDFFADAPAAVHGDEQCPTVGWTGADLLYRVRAQVIFEAHLVGGEILPRGIVNRRSTVGIPRRLADRGFVVPEKLFK